MITKFKIPLCIFWCICAFYPDLFFSWSKFFGAFAKKLPSPFPFALGLILRVFPCLPVEPDFGRPVILIWIKRINLPFFISLFPTLINISFLFPSLIEELRYFSAMITHTLSTIQIVAFLLLHFFRKDSFFHSILVLNSFCLYPVCLQL